MLLVLLLLFFDRYDVSRIDATAFVNIALVVDCNGRKKGLGICSLALLLKVRPADASMHGCMHQQKVHA